MTFCLGSSAWNIIKNEWIKVIKNMDKRQKQIEWDYIIKSKSTAEAVAKIFIKMLWGY